MKRQKSCGPRLGKLVHQLPGVVTFAYDLRFRRVIARWKGIIEEIHFGGSIMPLAIIENLDLEKTSFRPSKWPRKWKPAKNSKLPKWPENCFEPFGKGGWPPISTWIKIKAKKILTLPILCDNIWLHRGWHAPCEMPRKCNFSSLSKGYGVII